MEKLFFLVASAADYNNGSIRDDFLGYGSGNVFADTTIWMVIVLLVLALLYYYLINGFSSGFNGLFKFNYLWSWLITLLLAGVVGFSISYFQVGTYVYKAVDGVLPPIEQAGQRFILLCTIYSMIIYTLFSGVLKRWSKFAKFIPW